jgi:serine protease Do
MSQSGPCFPRRKRIQNTVLLFVIAFCSPALAGEDPPQARSSLAGLSAAIRQVTRKVTPAVVEVLVSGYSSDEDGKAAGTVSLQRSSGSGVIIDPSGYVITNAHVVEGAVTVKVLVALPSKTPDADPEPVQQVAQIIGTDRDSDLALLKIDAGPLPTLAFGNSDALAQGDLVLAVGSPLLLRNSVTMGVVSATARQVHEEDPILYIQTDASINPGDSGGALVDTDGHLMGVTTFIVSKSGANEGIGFAIPAKVVQEVYRQLREGHEVSRGYIGVFAQTVTPSLAAGLDLPVHQGALIADVEPDGPGEGAGLRRRDVIITLNDLAIASARQFNTAVYRTKVGDKIQLTVLRGTTRLSFEVPTVARPSSPPGLATLIAPAKSLISRLGVFCLELDGMTSNLISDLRRHYGVVVAARFPQGQGPYIDLRPGDVIHAINNTPVASLEILRKRIDAFPKGDSVALQIEREGRFQYVAFEIE